MRRVQQSQPLGFRYIAYTSAVAIVLPTRPYSYRLRLDRSRDTSVLHYAQLPRCHVHVLNRRVLSISLKSRYLDEPNIWSNCFVECQAGEGSSDYQRVVQALPRESLKRAYQEIESRLAEVRD